MERIVNGEIIELHVPTLDEIVNNMISPLLSTDEGSEWMWNQFIHNMEDIAIKCPKLREFIMMIQMMINTDWMFEFKTEDNLRTMHDQILEMWKYYKSTHHILSLDEVIEKYMIKYFECEDEDDFDPDFNYHIFCGSIKKLSKDHPELNDFIDKVCDEVDEFYYFDKDVFNHLKSQIRSMWEE